MSVRILATGLTGTIGRHFGPSVGDLGVRLEDPTTNFGSSLDNCVVIHSAAAVGEALVRRDLRRSYSVNVTGAVELARAVFRSSAERFIYVSTSHVYERQPEVMFLSESDSVLPQGQYALQKLVAEELITEVFRGEPSRLTIARVFSVVHQ
ncbi:MAG: NAD-dependent epimerase/dehydratase family protein, partial [Candidatus Nanopelagicaceae bacterium]